jgi:hypothetical protein
VSRPVFRGLVALDAGGTQIQPIVAAGKAFAYSLRHRAALEENRIDFPAGYWLHGGMMKACARLCASLVILSTSIVLI